MTDDPRILPLPPIPSNYSQTCQVWVSHHADGSPNVCTEPTAYCYPTQGGGSMALCSMHARKHLATAAQIGMKSVEEMARSSEGGTNG